MRFDVVYTLLTSKPDIHDLMRPQHNTVFGNLRKFYHCFH
jgi:hypothetical protein